MREIPILMHQRMVPLLLSDRKVQTRRLVKGDPVHVTQLLGRGRVPTGEFGLHLEHERIINKQVRCPWGDPGDRLWVRETWARDCDGNPVFRADGESAEVDRWRPSIHMPRFVARVILEVESVRVERLWDISAEDAIAEGMTCPNDRAPHDCNCVCSKFEYLWKDLAGEESWLKNPWVWVIGFRRIAP